MKPTFDDSEFSELQLTRRKARVDAIIKVATFTSTLESLMGILLVEAYNAGYADSQNETQGSFKLSD